MTGTHRSHSRHDIDLTIRLTEAPGAPEYVFRLEASDGSLAPGCTLPDSAAALANRCERCIRTCAEAIHDADAGDGDASSRAHAVDPLPVPSAGAIDSSTESIMSPNVFRERAR